MNTTVPTPESKSECFEKPGAEFLMLREKAGVKREFVAEQLNLRAKVIHLLENDAYSELPEPVFVRGYLRAYANLLEVSPEPFLKSYNTHHASDMLDTVKPIWHVKHEAHHGEKIVRWLAVVLGFIVTGAVLFWWQKEKNNTVSMQSNSSEVRMTSLQPNVKVPLSDVSKIESLFSNKRSVVSEESRG